MVFYQIAYYNILGVPLLIYLGITTLTLLILTLIFGYLVLKRKIKFNVHKIFGALTIVFALIHGFLAFGARFIG